MDLFESIDGKKNILPSREIFISALSDAIPGVVIAAIKKIPDKTAAEYKTVLYTLLKHQSPVVRTIACQKITVAPVDEDLDYLLQLFADFDWMPKECAFQSIRNYPDEKTKQKFFFIITSYLNEKNPDVLRQIYRTLKWYDDARAYSFLYKRSFLFETNLELMVIMQEIISIPNEKFRQRVSYISLNHPDYFVKREALRLLELR